MGGRKALPASPAIEFVADFDFVMVGATVAYKVGHVVMEPSDELVSKAGDKAVPYIEPEPQEPPATDPPAIDPPNDGQ